MEGDQKGGFSIFYADDGLDTGPVILQKSVDIEPNETVDTLYNRFLYPEGIKTMVKIHYLAMFIKNSIFSLCNSMFYLRFIPRELYKLVEKHFCNTKSRIKISLCLKKVKKFKCFWAVYIIFLDQKLSKFII